MRDRVLIGAGLFVGLLIAVVISVVALNGRAANPLPTSSASRSATPQSSVPAADDWPLDPAGQAIESIVWIEVHREDGTSLGYASGVVVGQDRVLTVWHAIDLAHSATVTLKCCDTYPVIGLVAVDEVQDLALLAVDLPDDHAVSVPIAQIVPEDGELVTINMVMPRLGIAFATKPVLSVRELTGNGLRLRSPVPSLPGSSGSPVLNADGELVAVIHGNGGADTTTCAVCTTDLIPSEGALIPLVDYATRDIDDLTRARRLWLKASKLWGDGEYREARDVLKEIVELDPNHWHAWLNLGISIDMLGDKENALEPIRRSIAIEPFHGEAHYSLGLVLLKMGQMDDAIASFLDAIKLDPFYNKPHGMLAAAYFQSGETNKAIAAGRTAVRLDPNAPEHNMNLSLFLERSGQAAEAADVLEAFCQENPRFGGHLNRLGSLCLDLKDGERAESAYRRALELRPTHPSSVFGLSVSLAAQRRYDEAERILDNFEEETGGHSALPAVRSSIQQMRGNFPAPGGG